MSKTIPLTKGYVAIVDDDDYENLSTHKWHTIKTRKITYAARTVGTSKARKKLYMHRSIMNADEGVLVDHRDLNGLNCQRSNLRLVSYSQNGMNRRIDVRNKSGASGVSFSKRAGIWKAYICIEKKSTHLGYFEDFDKALAARKAAEQQHYGEFART